MFREGEIIERIRCIIFFYNKNFVNTLILFQYFIFSLQKYRETKGSIEYPFIVYLKFVKSISHNISRISEVFQKPVLTVIQRTQLLLILTLGKSQISSSLINESFTKEVTFPEIGNQWIKS